MLESNIIRTNIDALKNRDLVFVGLIMLSRIIIHL